MTKREDTDRLQSQKYEARWIVGKTLIFPEPTGLNIISPDSAEFVDNTGDIGVAATILTDPSPEDRYGLYAGRTSVVPTAVYLERGEAEKICSSLDDLHKLHPSIIGEISLYDPDEEESLITVTVFSRHAPQEELVGIKRQIEQTGDNHGGASVLTYEYNENGEWTSIEWAAINYKVR